MRRGLILCLFLGFLSFNLFTSNLSAEEALPPLITMKVYREDGLFVARQYEFADWVNDSLTEPQLDVLRERQSRMTGLMQRRGYQALLTQFLEGNNFWHIAKFGVWIRFPESNSSTYYFLPYHRSAAEVLAYFDTPENQDRRVDILWDPLRLDSAGPGSISGHMLRIHFSELKNYVSEYGEDILQVLLRVGFKMEESFSAEAREGAEPIELSTPCVRFAREIGLSQKSSGS